MMVMIIRREVKQWIERYLFYYERTESSVNINIIPYKIKKRKGSDPTTLDTAILEYRRSFMEGYGYITISIAHYFSININLHRPL